jgi:hypothetical protein
MSGNIPAAAFAKKDNQARPWASTATFSPSPPQDTNLHGAIAPQIGTCCLLAVASISSLLH